MKLLSVVRKEWLFFLCILVAFSISLLWPGDAFWPDYDQVTFISQALMANVFHTLSSYYHAGGVVPIHPFTVWIYQLFFLITSDIIRIIVIKQFLVLSICLAGLYYLANTLNYNKYGILIYFASPCHYIVSRMLVENTFLVPFSLLLFVFFAWFYKHKGYLPLFCWVVCIIVMFHLHPRSLILTIPFSVIFFVFEHKWFKKHWLGSLLILLWGGIMCFPYLSTIIQQLHVSDTPDVRSLPETNKWLNFLFIIISGGLWYSYDFLQLISDIYLSRWGIFPSVVKAVIGITMVGYLFLLLGMGLALSGLVKRIRSRDMPTLEDGFDLLCLLTIVLYSAVLFIFPIHFNFWHHSGLWFCSFYLIWKAITVIWQKRFIRYVVPAYVVAMLVVWSACLGMIHKNNSGMFAIKNSVYFASKVAGYSPESDIVLSANWEDDAERFADAVIAGSDRAVLGFYYRAFGLILKDVIWEARAKNINSLYSALKPLVFLERQGQKEFLPAQVLVIKKDERAGENGLMLIDDPAQVRMELNRLRSGK